MNFFSAVCKIKTVLHLLAGLLQNLVQDTHGLLPAHVTELPIGFFCHSEIAALGHLPVILPDDSASADCHGNLVALNVLYAGGEYRICQSADQAAAPEEVFG